MWLEITIVCITIFTSIISTLVYFAAFHETRKFEYLEKRLDHIESTIHIAQDELTQIDNKINFRGHRRL